jgi:hypothetical protein
MKVAGILQTSRYLREEVTGMNTHWTIQGCKEEPGE